MDRPSRFEEHRWLGDKRHFVVHDLDHVCAEDVIDELMAARTYLCFGPDEVSEARNRGYRLCRGCRAVGERRDEPATSDA